MPDQPGIVTRHARSYAGSGRNRNTAAGKWAASQAAIAS